MITIKSAKRIDYIEISQITMASAAGNYVRIYCDNKEYVQRIAFSDFADMLKPHGFLRCHRSYAVNVSKVVSLVQRTADSDELVLENGLKAPISQPYRKIVEDTLVGILEI